MQKVILEGTLGEKFGKSWNMSCRSVADMLKLIACQTPGFKDHLIAAAEAGINYRIQKDGVDLGEDDLTLLLADETIRVEELPAGASSDIGKVIAGIALVLVAGPLVGALGLTAGGATYVTITAIGVNLALQGLAGMMAPGPETEDGTQEGYLFNGPKNTIIKGQPVPVLYGELVIGGAPIGISYLPAPPENTANATNDLNSGYEEDDLFYDEWEYD